MLRQVYHIQEVAEEVYITDKGDIILDFVHGDKWGNIGNAYGHTITLDELLDLAQIIAQENGLSNDYKIILPVCHPKQVRDKNYFPDNVVIPFPKRTGKIAVSWSEDYTLFAIWNVCARFVPDNWEELC